MTEQALSRRDRMIPWYFVMFFVGLAVVDGVLVTLAVRTQTGVVTDHAYEKGLAYNEVVDAAAAQAALGWKGAIEFVPSAGNAGTLRLKLSDTSGKLLTLDSATATIIRPTQAGQDFEVTLSNGEAPVTFPEAGQWEVRIFANVGGTPYQQSKRIVVE
jgi:nitrogen fixation protein FixH